MARSENTIKKISNDEYYTPKFIFDALNIVFDIDVASPPGGVEWIPKKSYFTKEDDALIQAWDGKVWLNPPYSYPGEFMKKFVQHKNGIALVQMSKAKWFEYCWSEVDALCLPPVHLKFEHQTAGKKGIFMPVVLMAMGEECVFALRNSGLGRVR